MSNSCNHTIHKTRSHYGWDNAFAPRLTIAPRETVEFDNIMGGRHPSATPVLSGRQDRGRERGHRHALLAKPAREIPRKLRIAQHQRHDRVLPGQKFEPEGGPLDALWR